MEERVVVLREELAACRLHRAAEQDRHTAGEARLTATADRETQALRAQVLFHCSWVLSVTQQGFRVWGLRVGSHHSVRM